MTRYLYLTAGTLDCTGALDGWTITSPTARACAPDDDLLLRRGDVITLDGEVYRPAGYRPSTYDERLVSASVERPVWVRIGRIWPASPVGARHDTPRQAGARAGALTSWTTRGRGRSPR